VRHVALYNAFAICLARRAQHPLLILNLFQDDAVKCQKRLHAFLRQVRPVNLTSVQRVWEQCLPHGQRLRAGASSTSLRART
jgi:hypothetical protein